MEGDGVLTNEVGNVHGPGGHSYECWTPFLSLGLRQAVCLRLRCSGQGRKSAFPQLRSCQCAALRPSVLASLLALRPPVSIARFAMLQIPLGSSRCTSRFASRELTRCLLS